MPDITEMNERGHETTDAHLGGIVLFAVGLFVTVLVVSLLMWMLFVFLTGREADRSVRQYPLGAGQESREPTGPRLQTNPREDLRRLRAAEDAVLSSYGWVDRNQGIAHIPIGDAMKLTLQRGLPVRGKP
jgi:hypothetical protein